MINPRRHLVALAAGCVVVGCAGGPGRPAATTPAASSAAVTPTVTRSAPSSELSTSTPPGGSAPASRSALAPSSTPTGPASAYVRVAVATVWRSPGSPRPVDQLALGVPVNVRGWLAAMTVDQRRDLQGRVDTQALLDDRVLVTGVSGPWAHVVLPAQPSPLDRRGYPGWIPLAQLSFAAPAATPTEAVVVSPTAWLSTPTGARAAEVSFATRLPTVGRDPGWVTVRPVGSRGDLRIRASDVVVTAPGARPLPPTGPDVVRAARAFQGLAYLWGGTSGFGFDCSGLTYLDYLAHGRVLPRDADAQAATGTAVPKAGLRPGDLVFLASSGLIHHVALYVGSGLVVQSPQTGASIGVASMSAEPYASQYWGARRYLP